MKGWFYDKFEFLCLLMLVVFGCAYVRVFKIFVVLFGGDCNKPSMTLEGKLVSINEAIEMFDILLGRVWEIR